MQDRKISNLIQQLQQDHQDAPRYTWNNDEFCYKGHLYLRKQSTLKSKVVSCFHSSPTMGHSGFTKTYESVNHYFFSDDMKHLICNFVIKCDTCHCNKGETVKPSGTLQPLPLPPTIWTNISMDFIVSLPKSGYR